MFIVRQAWINLLRDLRSGDLRLLILSLLIAVGSLTAVGFFSDRLRLGLERDARQLLGADLVLRGDVAIPDNLQMAASKRGLTVAQTVSFPTMALAGAQSQLVALKAVSSTYPLRGHLTLAPTLATSYQAPPAGEVWLDQAAADTLGLQLGNNLQLGEAHFKLTRIVVLEPDRGAAFMNFAPRAMIALDDLPATKLVQFGSRVTYRLLVAGSDEAVSAYQGWLDQQIKQSNLHGYRVDTLEQGRPEMRQTLDRAERFLSLVAMLAAMLSGLAVALAARRFAEKRLDSVAIMRCLGLQQRAISKVFLLEFLILGLLASSLGLLLGFAAHFMLAHWLAGLMNVVLPAPTMMPLLQAGGMGLLMMLGFGLPPIMRLSKVSPLRVLRRDMGGLPLSIKSAYGLGLLAFTALLVWQAHDIELGLLTAAGFAMGLLLFLILGRIALQLLGQMAYRLPMKWGMARAIALALKRRLGMNTLQIAALALGLMALLLLTFTRTDLVQGWQSATPPDAPNRFVINIQPDQKNAMQAELNAAKVMQAEFYPMIRGRLIEVNGKLIDPNQYQDERARSLINREFNLSYMDDLPKENKIVAGQWFGDTAMPVATSITPQASVEEGLAKTLGLKLGDVLRFDIAGQTIAAPITSLRKLNWSSMRVNFFVVLPTASLQDYPQTWITAFHLPTSQNSAARGWLSRFPNLTIVDVGAMINQVQQILEQVIKAVEFLFLFALLSGLLVLYTALMASREARIAEVGLLRALGASRGYLLQTQLGEFALMGLLAGLLAAAGATVIGVLLAVRIFEFDWVFNVWIFPAGALTGLLVAMLAAWFGLRPILQTPPWVTLRDASAA
ncbi:ABC transporter permease [Ampullimonas aquatilis]|uniref:ABC transporter permease n=1 Tax=Ampullimonas aquatilis TaxID=1341549 RepID=UPI003C7177CC